LTDSSYDFSFGTAKNYLLDLLPHVNQQIVSKLEPFFDYPKMTNSSAVVNPIAGILLI
jgi:hypothetical protein